MYLSPTATTEDLQIFELERLEKAQTASMRFSAMPPSPEKNEMALLGRKERRNLVNWITFYLWLACVKLGMQDDADCLLHGGKSPTLEAWRHNQLLANLNGR